MGNIMAAEVRMVQNPRDFRLNGSFLQLPPETRLYIYQYLLPPHCDVMIHWDGHLHSQCDFERRLINNRYLLQKKRAEGAEVGCLQCRNHRSACVAMLQTCKMVHEELSVLVYRRLQVTLDGGMCSIFEAKKLVSASIRPLITNFTFSIARYKGPSYGLTSEEEKPYLKTMITSLPSLRELSIRGLDRSADHVEKGTKWKPKVLRRLRFILENIENLIKVFYVASDHCDWTTGRLTDADGQAAENEVELDIEGEYGKWLRKLRDRKKERKCRT